MHTTTHAGRSLLHHGVDRWLRASCRKGPRAIVIGSSVNGLSFVRSLGRRGVPVLALDSAPGVTEHSRYAKCVVLPNIERQPEAWVDFLAEVTDRVDEPPVVFATSDSAVGFLAASEDVLRSRLRFLVPPPDVVLLMVDKREQYALADSLEVPIPRTLFPRSVDELEASAVVLRYPCILKPSHSHRARGKIGGKVVVVDSAPRLVREYERRVEPDLGFVVQEIVPGPDSNLFGYMAFWDAEGRELAWVTKRKLRQFPRGFGDGCFQETVDAPNLADVSRRLLSAVGYRGFVGTEFKLDERDGVFRLMEVNPRTIIANQLAIEAGVDFPWIGYRYLTGAEPEPPPDFRRGVRFVYETLDIRRFLASRDGEGPTLRAWLRSLRGVRAKALWSRDDPAPFLFSLFYLLGHLVRAFIRLMGPDGS